ncbi:glycoside hydrolase family 127 protein [Maribacter sp. ACAM166]|uniref:glycoside hydrolase family 127 protein n=1 Tax=Maribacter sp. ACAM166 TaxID=2508996 RepID=UPI0010FD5DA7|nr:beta-L-arabinofuranosidase domain-containing protein [Maribacter sp. ACAM166]TLP72737.1 glycoside hydrolase family 127 protein [Maribacter sp. ACAM166]
MKKKLFTLLTITILIALANCKEKKEEVAVVSESIEGPGYKLTPVNIQNVKLTDEFWLPIIKRVQEKTVAYAIQKCEEEGRFDNFLIAGGKMNGPVKGVMPFDDSDVYKVIEGASNSLISAPNEPLEKLLDSLIGIVKTGQEADGYLTTWRTINPAKPPAEWVEVKEGKRWESLFMSHELYNAGHMYEAAVVHFKATGKRNFLDIALKNADLMVATFGDGEGKIPAVPGHQIIETGLIKLYEVTGKEAYLDLAKYFLDNRGNPDNHELFGAYSQDHIPVVDQEEVVGHAVRAVYMYAAMTDIAALKNDTAYHKAIDNLWNNMVEKKMYLTGGIGAKHEGEAFGENYELPNLTAYNETCASIGDVYWNHRMFNLTGDVKYFDVIERTLYNGLISGLSLSGTEFFYPNALESDGKYEFNQGAATRKSWFDCSCCPTNVVRFIPAMPGLIYSKSKNDVYVNLYASNEATIDLPDNSIDIIQKTSYPWNGNVEIKVKSTKGEGFNLKMRIPGWANNEVLPGGLYQYINNISNKVEVYIDGKKEVINSLDGYVTLSGKKVNGKNIELKFPMEVRMVETSDKVLENRGKIALEYGPIVYAVEEIDNQNNFDGIIMPSVNDFQVQMEQGLLGGVNTIKDGNFKAIPYYAWSNRGVGKMKVWIPKENE